MAPVNDPIAQLQADRERARAAGDPFTDLCVLATAPDGEPPGVRVVVLRDTGPSGIGLLISATSPKWRPLTEGRYECLLPWLAIRRQYRIRGGLAPMGEERLAAYWDLKVHESRLLDLYYERVSAQSSRVASRDRKSTRLNSSHANISYAVFCLKKKKKWLLTRSSSILFWCPRGPM